MKEYFSCCENKFLMPLRHRNTEDGSLCVSVPQWQTISEDSIHHRQFKHLSFECLGIETGTDKTNPPEQTGSWLKIQNTIPKLRKTRSLEYLYSLKSSIAITILFFSIRAFSQPDSKPVSFILPKLIPSERIVYYPLGDRNIPIRILQYGNEKDILYINVHDSEPTSVEAAKTILQVKGGMLIKIENNHQRNIRFRLNNITYTFDPNRMFSRGGIDQSLKNYGHASKQATDEIEKFATRILQLIPDKITCIVALHNNSDQGYSVVNYLAGHERQFDAKAVYADSLQDIDDIALTTDSVLYEKMADYRYNTIWQDNENAKKDGSLSIYCGEKNKRYINIETENGQLNQHIEMLEKLWIILETQNKKSPVNF